MDIWRSKKAKPCCCESEIKVVSTSTQLTLRDIIGSWKVRFGIGRMNYKVDPGLYSVGKPDSNSQVLVTANYKLSFDILRRELKGINSWILVLDTKGINVWCAAGKGYFGTDELINRIKSTNLAKVVSHNRVILPQLGAVGVSAHKVKKMIGFNIVYGPVRARDIGEFLDNGMKATSKMRTVEFGLIDRLVLTPIEVIGGIEPSLILFGLMFIINSLGIGKFNGKDIIAYIGAVFVGCFLVPVLLPWIPGRAFAWKGWLLGLLWVICVNTLILWPKEMGNILLVKIGYFFILPSVSAYYAMNFTGSSTYTSFSGVLKEMKVTIPFITITVALGVIMVLIH